MTVILENKKLTKEAAYKLAYDEILTMNSWSRFLNNDFFELLEDLDLLEYNYTFLKKKFNTEELQFELIGEYFDDISVLEEIIINQKRLYLNDYNNTLKKFNINTKVNFSDLNDNDLNQIITNIFDTYFYYDPSWITFGYLSDYESHLSYSLIRYHGLKHYNITEPDEIVGRSVIKFIFELLLEILKDKNKYNRFVES